MPGGMAGGLWPCGDLSIFFHYLTGFFPGKQLIQILAKKMQDFLKFAPPPRAGGGTVPAAADCPIRQNIPTEPPLMKPEIRTLNRSTWWTSNEKLCDQHQMTNCVMNIKWKIVWMKPTRTGPQAETTDWNHMLKLQKYYDLTIIRINVKKITILI